MNIVPMDGVVTAYMKVERADGRVRYFRITNPVDSTSGVQEEISAEEYEEATA